MHPLPEHYFDFSSPDSIEAWKLAHKVIEDKSLDN